ncbi:serine/threonine-protein kinase PINK1, mitochondrial isoform X1 [Synchiropus splendidus]|uniref:serine/threonine-protein kinase PINK1, mitochondrial isoform X1 n=1 Tax=Synchiropus splendidus TaxID=270530 RepID=UPI00237DC8F5|nr:serine/threonine-protein kinase PINK1, mitochondrial isoform X1 [Synchiropus splendidus]
MSVRRVLSRGLELGRSVVQLGFAKSIGRVTAKFRTDRLRAGPALRSVQPRAFLPARYRYYRVSLRGAAAQLQAAAFRRGFGGGPRNRAALLAFGLGVGLIEQQLEEERSTSRTCEEIQAVFRQRKFQTPLKPFRHGYKLDDYVVGKQIGKGSNAAVYEVAPEEEETSPGPSCCSLRSFPLALKMMWNFGAGSSSESILKSMSQELVPAAPSALKRELLPDGHFGVLPKRLSPHPNVIRVHRAFTADVPLLPGAQEEYPDMLPARLNPAGLGNNRTLFLVMKNYPCTLRQYLQRSSPGRRQATLMVLQLLEGVDHLCTQGVAHRDIKSDNVLLEFDSGPEERATFVHFAPNRVFPAAGCPRLVISDFGCSLSRSDRSLLLPFNSMWVDRGGNVSLMAPEVASAVPGSGVVIDYSKADAWAVGAMSYEILGQTNPFYRPVGLESRRYHEHQLPALPPSAPADLQLVIQVLLRRNPSQRPSARVAANMLHLSLWGRQLLASRDGVAVKKLVDWLLCRSAVALLKGCRGPDGTRVEAELQRCFLSNLELEDLRTAVGFLLHGQHQRQASLPPA